MSDDPHEAEAAAWRNTYTVSAVEVWSPVPDLRWLTRPGWDGPERVLQQAWRCISPTIKFEWRDIEEVNSAP
jgi:hypothetical protein